MSRVRRPSMTPLVTLSGYRRVMARRKKQEHEPGIDVLPSGSIRVRVYAGIDPVTQQRYYLRDTIPAGPKALDEAKKVRTRFKNQVDEQRHPRTNATVNQLLDKYFELLDCERTTKETYRGYADNHIRTLIGTTPVGRIDAEILDSLYAELRRCRTHLDPRKCATHECKPLSSSTIRQIHFILSGAFRDARRWKWVSVNPVDTAKPPAAPKPDPDPPTPRDAARILNAAWADADWGTVVWLAMTTGARRGEVCALRFSRVQVHHNPVTATEVVPEKWLGPDDDHDCAVAGCEWALEIKRSIAQHKSETWEKDTKTHQQRRVALDLETAVVLNEHWLRCKARAEALGHQLSDDAFIFSLSPDNTTYLIPHSVSQRYDRLAVKLGIDTTLHNLRHYSATELISAGVDVRTVAGRLGHAGGGATTLKVYSAWVAESDQRAATTLFSRMPVRPAPPPTSAQRALADPQHPYEVLAVELRSAILAGSYPNGTPLPPTKQIANEHNVSAGTAHRAISLLKDWGLARVEGRRTVVVYEPAPEEASVQVAPTLPEPTIDASAGPMLLNLEVGRLGELIRTVTAEADPTNPSHLRQLLVAAARRDGGDLADYELDVRRAGDSTLLTTFVALPDLGT
jgi:integrase